ncbi:MAG TPA: hypothetical protein DDX71_00800 [Ruminococcus sp.]|nr:hypothetical protein [Ruminococcus sp.]
MEKTYHLHCKQCGIPFTGSKPALKYCCESCREAGYRRSAAAREAAKARNRKPLQREYTCQACGRRIRVTGRSGLRKCCDRCLAKTRYGRVLLSRRNDLPEEVIG